MKHTKNNKIIVYAAVLCSLFLFIALLCFFAARWYISVYGDLGFDAILYTLLSDIGGTESNLIIEFINASVVPTIIITVLLGIVLFATPKRRLILHVAPSFRFRLYPFSRTVSIVCSIALSLILLLSASIQVSLVDYIKYITQQSTIYNDKYIDPATANIIFPEQKQNLIYIYLESMETTFLSKELDGGIDINAIPELYALAQENVNFSHNDSVGGFTSLSGSSWTIGAMVSQTTGIPLKVPFNANSNSYGQDTFLPGVTSLSDILHQNGYYQALMVGSDATFGGRKQFYEQHGTDKIYDLYTARADGIIPEDYYVWWGMEDAYLFDYAKQELSEISKQKQPFAFTMLTVDTHHIGGYVCEYCGNEHSEQYENVLACSSKQVNNFVNWIKQQDFYENTTIIICGDHPTMDSDYITGNVSEDYQRKVYNCFINSKTYTNNIKNREFCTLDMLPSTLAAIGCIIEGDRLGLGTNLFSSTPTLCEELGTDVFNAELAKTSDYYTQNFYFE